ncbi:mediator of RNA polymerase II transcription subunit 9-like isoform X1 [Aristolochia californica]|uniref:mediator of RNA polymerase II transcription subunit 9-like isoform X1 n=1 Tax=Aristolochia californica TaxID=171875 RepID=UPI0035E281B6
MLRVRYRGQERRNRTDRVVTVGTGIRSGRRMDHPYGGGSWMMVPNQSHIPVTSTQDHTHHFQLQRQQQQPPQQQQPQLEQHHHQSLASHFHLLHVFISYALSCSAGFYSDSSSSSFDVFLPSLQLVEKLAEAIESGTRDQQSDALVNELTTHFEKCQQLLNSISGSIGTKVMTVEGQNHEVEESEQLLNQRKDLITKYRNSVEELLKSDYHR